MDDFVPKTQNVGELAALTSILMPEAQPAPEVDIPPTPSAAVSAQPAPVQAPAPPVASEPVSVAPVAASEAASYTFKPQLSEEIQALLEEPDFEEEAALEVQAELDDPDAEYEYTDPEVAKKLRVLEKRNAFLEGQVVAKSRKGWVEEAKRTYPDLARLIPGEIEGIAATSRRAFLRAADNMNTKYATVFAGPLAEIESARKAITEGAVEVAREEVAAAWGKPAADTLPPVGVAQQEALDKARKSGRLQDSLKVLLSERPVI